MKKFKLNMIVGKKQIILASLVVILSIAVYLNWQYTANGDLIGQANNNLVDQGESNKNYGDVKQVDNQETDYFAEASLEKEQNRGEVVDTLTNILKDAEISEEERNQALEQSVELAKQIEKEGTMENLIIAKGFEKCVVYYNGEQANIIVKTTEDMTAEQAAQIKSIVVEQTALKAENINIVERK